MLPINDISYYLKNARVLLIDDSEPFQRLTSAILKKAGVASVTSVATLAEGMHEMNYMSAATSAVPEFDLVIMDINLPDGNGIEGCKFISSHVASFNIPVMVISGDFKAQTVNDAFQAGASDYLQKPLVAELLKMRIGSLLKLRSMEYQHLQSSRNTLSSY